MPEGKFIQIIFGETSLPHKEGWPAAAPGNYEDLEIIGQDPSMFHCIGTQSERFTELLNYLGNTYFSAEKSLNEEFEIRIIKWQETVFLVVSIPLWKREFCYEAAEKTGLELTAVEEKFPLVSENAVMVKE